MCKCPGVVWRGEELEAPVSVTQWLRGKEAEMSLGRLGRLGMWPRGERWGH